MPPIRSRLFKGTSNVLPETTAMQYSLHVQNVEGRVNLDPRARILVLVVE